MRYVNIRTNRSISCILSSISLYIDPLLISISSRILLCHKQLDLIDIDLLLFFFSIFSLLLNVLDDDVRMKTSDLYSSIDLVNTHKRTRERKGERERENTCCFLQIILILLVRFYFFQTYKYRRIEKNFHLFFHVK